MSKKNITKKSKRSLNLTSFFARYWPLLFAVLIVAITGLILFWIERNQLNPDGVSYIEIGRHYSQFNLKEAINGYWSPLISWMLVPFFWLHLDPLFGFRFINLFIALIIIFSLGIALSQTRLFTITERVAQFLFLASFGILLAYWGNSVITPDLLSGALLLLVITLIRHFLAHRTIKSGIYIGISLSLLYFSKSLTIYVSIILIVLLIASDIYRFRTINKSTISALMVFTLLSGVWISAISLKYNEFTVSTAGKYNFTLIGPAQPPHPQTIQGYLPLHNPHSIWAWEDPSYFNMPSWKISEHPKYYINHILITAHKTINYLFAASPLVVLGMVSLFAKKRDSSWNRSGHVLILFSLLVIGAYSVTLIEARYLWLIEIPIISFAALLIHDQSIDARVLATVMGVIFISTTVSLIPTLETGYESQIQQGSVKYISQQSTSIVLSNTRIASSYPENYKFCYFTHAKCLGNYMLSGSQKKDSAVLNAMKKEDLQYYVEFSQRKLPYLHLVRQTHSSEHSCYQAVLDKYKPCGTVYLTIYKI